jgi:zinc transporter ZupT
VLGAGTRTIKIIRLTSETRVLRKNIHNIWSGVPGKLSGLFCHHTRNCCHPYENWGNVNIAYFMSFASCMLISVSFTHMIPTAFLTNTNAPTFLVAGFLLFYLINRYLNSNISHKYGHVDYIPGLIPMLGIGFHSFLESVICSVTFNIRIFTGVLAAIGMSMHEFPQGIVTFLLLERAGYERRKSTLLAIRSAAISTPIGTLVFYPFIFQIDRSILGALLVLSSGALVYVGVTHLLPAVEKENKRYSLVALMIGICVAVMIVIL